MPGVVHALNEGGADGETRCVREESQGSVWHRVGEERGGAEGGFAIFEGFR